MRPNVMSRFIVSKGFAMRLRPLGFAFISLLMLVALPGCDEAQEDRVLIQEKGEYQGPADEGLSQPEVDTLRDRVRLQSDS